MKKRNYAQVLAVVIGIILFVTVALNVTAGVSHPLSNQVSFTNATLNGVINTGTNTTNQSAALPATLCAKGYAFTSVTDNTANYSYTSGSNYTLTAANGSIYWNSFDAVYGTTVYLTGTCQDLTYLDAATSRTMVDLLPLFIGIGAMLYVVAMLLA